MLLAADIVIGFVALLHIYFLILEIFLWDKPIGLSVFGLTASRKILFVQPIPAAAGLLLIFLA